MRESLMLLIINALSTIQKFQGSDGTIRVYDYPEMGLGGYPYCVITAFSMESKINDNQRDLRYYNFMLSIIGEKFGDPGGFSQSDALKTMRNTEDTIVAYFDANNSFQGQGLGVIRSLPTNTKYGYTDNNSRVVLEIMVQFQVIAGITY
jgi:hypothetical protein